MKKFHRIRLLAAAALAAGLTLGSTGTAQASSHMDAPLVTLDDPANTTDVYAFVSERDGRPYLTTALAVYPFEEPGIGPNAYRFDDNVRYTIHLALGNDIGKGRETVSYDFSFQTDFADAETILQHYRGVVGAAAPGSFHPNQNMRQTYTVRKRVGKKSRFLGRGIVPPNNQGIVTPLYNQDDDGEQPAREGVERESALDAYTRGAIAKGRHGYVFFAGQRDDGFYADIQAVFDLLNFRSGDDFFDSQGGFNVHTIVLNIPLDDIGGEKQVAGVWATTARRQILVMDKFGTRDARFGPFIQVGRQGNPLFCEALVALEDKDRYNRLSPEVDAKLFKRYAKEPELARLINDRLGAGVMETGRTDLVGIFIPDVIKVDLSTGPARLAGGGDRFPGLPDDTNFSRLSVFGGDLLTSRVQAGFFGNGTLPGGWPNGRRFGDDVLDIAVSAIFSDLRDPLNPVLVPVDGVDNVSDNDISYNKVFPYAGTPLNGRNHSHH